MSRILAESISKFAEELNKTKPIKNRLKAARDVILYLQNHELPDAGKIFEEVQDIYWMRGTREDDYIKNQTLALDVMLACINSYPPLLSVKIDKMIKYIYNYQFGPNKRMSVLYSMLDNKWQIYYPTGSIFELIREHINKVSDYDLLLNLILKLYQNHKNWVADWQSGQILQLLRGIPRIGINERFVKLELQIMDAIIHSGNISFGILEDIALSLCQTIFINDIATWQVWKSMIDSDYNYYIVKFLLNTLSSQNIQGRPQPLPVENTGGKKEDNIYVVISKGKGVNLSQEDSPDPAARVIQKIIDTNITKAYRGIIYFVARSCWLEDLCPFISWNCILNYFQTAIQNLSEKAIFEIVLALERLISRKYKTKSLKPNKEKDLDIEWHGIFEIFMACFSKDKVRAHNDFLAILGSVFSMVRTAYINGNYYGSIDVMFAAYDLYKSYLKDPFFDSLYLYYLFDHNLHQAKSQWAQVFKTYFTKGIITNSTLPKKSMIINALLRMYEESTSFEKSEIIEEIAMESFEDIGSLSLTTDEGCTILNLFSEIAKNTYNETQFYIILDFMTNIFVSGTDAERAKSPIKREAVTMRLNKQNPAEMGQGLTRAKTNESLPSPGVAATSPKLTQYRGKALDILFELFSHYYLSYPPKKLLALLDILVKLIKTGESSIVYPVLDFLGNLTVDPNFCIKLAKLDVSTFLSVKNKYAPTNEENKVPDNEEYTLDMNVMFDSIFAIFQKAKAHNMIILALRVIESLVKSHFGIAYLTLEELCKKLVELNSTMMNKSNITACVKICQIVHALLLYCDKKDSNIWKLTGSHIVLFYMQYIGNLNELYTVLQKEIDKAKLKLNSKKQNILQAKVPPNSIIEYIISEVFNKSYTKELCRYVKILMSGLSLGFYICPPNLRGLIPSMIEVLKLYLNDYILIEKFGSNLLQVLQNLFHSPFAGDLELGDLLSVQDMCLFIGWINSPSFGSHPSLQSYLGYPTTNNRKQPFRFIAIVLEKQENARKKGGNIDQKSHMESMKNISRLTYPGVKSSIDGGIGGVSTEGGNTQLLGAPSASSPHKKLMEKVGQVQSAQDEEYLTYQEDGKLQMHLSSLVLVSYFTLLPIADRHKVMPVIQSIFALEIKKSGSPIIMQSIITYELLQWYLTNDLARTCLVGDGGTKNPELPPSRKKIWLLNDNVLSISVEDMYATMILRNPISNIKMGIKIENIKQQYELNQETNLKAVNLLFENFIRTGEELPKIPDTGKSEPLDSFMLPQYFLSCLPFALFNKFGDKKTGWEGFDNINELFLQLLDSNSVYNTHSVGILYIPPQLKEMKEYYILRAKGGSAKFQHFLSSLGKLIDIREDEQYNYIGGLPRNGSEGVYGLIRRDLLNQVFFHVNTLMQHCANQKDEDRIAENILKHIDTDYVVCFWNEHKLQVPLDLLKSMKIKFAILIRPMEKYNYFKLKMINMLGDKINHYGPLIGSCTVHYSDLGALIYRTSVNADIMTHKMKFGKETYYTNFIKRCAQIKEIKIKAFSSSNTALPH